MYGSYSFPLPIRASRSLASIDFLADNQLASFISFEPTSLTVTFDGQKINDELNLIDKVFFVKLKLYDENQNFVFYIQALRISQRLLE